MRLFYEVMRVPSKRELKFTLALLCSLAWSSAATQTVPPLERIVTIAFTNETESETLKKLSQKANVTFSYGSTVLDGNNRVNGNYEDIPLRIVLETIFEGRLQFKQRGNYIILTRAPEDPKKKSVEDPPLTISGYVVDAISGEKIWQASVYDRSTLTAAITNEYGYFKLTIDKPEGETQLSVNKIFYRDTLIDVAKGGPNIITVHLAPEEIEFVEQDIILPQSDSIFISDTTRHRVITPRNDSARVTSREKFAQLKEKILSKFRINMQNIRDTLYRPFQVSLVPFVGTNRKLSGNVVNDYSFNILGGHSKGVKKLEFGGLFNINEADVQRVQLAGLFNKNGGTMDGWQMAGLFNMNKAATGWLQVGGLYNLNQTADLKVQMGGLFNMQNSDAAKVQIAGLINANGGASHGVQIAGLVNANSKPSSGFQLAGLVNVNGGADENQVTQVSGVLNYAKNIRGAQIGLFNVADSLDGVAFGLLSYVNKGYHKIEVSADEVFYTNISFRTGVHQFYNIITAGIKPGDSENFWTVGYGFGTAPRLSRRVYLNFDLTSNQISRGRFTPAVNLVNKLYSGVDIQVAGKLSIAAGITLNAHVTNTTYTEYPELFSEYKPRIISDRTYSNDANVKIWWGAKVGVRFL